MSQDTSLDYRSRNLKDSTDGLEWAACVSLVFSVMQILWIPVMGILFYFLAPVSWHYGVYDNWFCAWLLWLFMSLPAVLSLFVGSWSIAKLRKQRGARFGVVLACVGMGIALPLLELVFWMTVISPDNPHAPGYWL